MISKYALKRRVERWIAIRFISFGCVDRISGEDSDCFVELQSHRIDREYGLSEESLSSSTLHITPRANVACGCGTCGYLGIRHTNATPLDITPINSPLNSP